MAVTIQGSCRKSLTNIMARSVDTPIGLLKLSACEGGLHAIEKHENSNNENSIQDFKLDSNIPVGTSNDHLDKITDWIRLYFDSPDKLSSEKIEFCFWNSSLFDENVLKTLFESTKFGEKITYKELAVRSNREGANRAVGSAMRKNPFPLVIPCHRVVRSDGTIGNYGLGGQEVKKFLLEHEKCNAMVEK